jgi:hypothetical protein
MSRASTFGIFPEKSFDFEERGEPVMAAFEESRNPELLRLVGTDAQTVVLDCYAQDPARLPEVVRIGDRAIITWHGQHGVFTLLGIYESQMDTEVEAEGQGFWGSFKASA